MKKKVKDKRFIFRLTKETKQKLQQKAMEEKTSAAKIIDRLLNNYLKTAA